MGGTSVRSCDSQPRICPLLSLPGELRNRIYSFCIEEGPISLPASRTCYGHLRYVCKLLYIEYAPIYLATTAVTLHAADIDRYFAAFYQDLQSCKGTVPIEPTEPHLASHFRGQIRIDLPIGATLDLSSFANLRSLSLKTHITIVRGGNTDRPLEDASELLRTIIDPSCPANFQETVERILFRYSVHSEVVIKLHRGVLFGNLSGLMPDQNPRQWLIQQGLPALQHLKIVMESSEGVVRAPVGTSIARFKGPRRYMQLYPVNEPGGSSPRTSYSKS